MKDIASMHRRLAFVLLALAPVVACAQTQTWGIKSNQQLGGMQFTQPGTSAPGKPGERMPDEIGIR